MNKTLMRILSIALLMMVSMTAGAKVEVLLDGYEGGTIKVKSQADNDDGSTTVTITVTPNQGYTITRKGITVVAVYPTTSQSGTRALDIARPLELSGPTEVISYPNSVDYQFTAPSGLNAWVQSADFQVAKRGDGGTTRTYCYYVVNKSGEVSVMKAINQESGGVPTLPEAIQTPLVNTYHYYKFDAPASYYTAGYSNNTYTGYGPRTWVWTNNSAWAGAGNNSYNGKPPFGVFDLTKLAAATELTTLPDANTDILVTYDLPIDGKTIVDDVLFDLHGTTDYTIKNNASSRYFYTDGNTITLTATEGETDEYLWNFYGNDPYNIILRSKKKGDDYQWAAKSNSTNGQYNNLNNVTITQQFVLRNESTLNKRGTSPTDESTCYTYHSFIITKGSSNGNFELMVTYTKGFNKSGDSDWHIFPYLSFNGTDASAATESKVRGYTGGNANATEISFKHQGTNIQTTITPIIKVSATPVINIDNDNATATITTATDGATIYYTTDGTMPSASNGTTYSSSFSVTDGMTLKAIAIKAGIDDSEVATQEVSLQCATPVITRIDKTFTISCSSPTSGVSIYYTTDGSTPSGNSTLYQGPVPFDDYDFTVKAIAIKTGYKNSEIAEKLILEDLNGSGTADDPFLIASSNDYKMFVSKVNEDGANAYYKVTGDGITASSDAVTATFTGVFDGGLHTISGLTHPLFSETNGAVVKNVILKDVSINQEGHVGAITGTAGSYTRIYNCGILPSNNLFTSETSSIASTGGYCGGLVGWLKDDSRVVNCYSYATIGGGTTVGGIVGYNDFASTAEESGGKYTKLRTMVVNCMFYGDITGGSSRYPVYGGQKILNTGNNGVNNYDFYREEASLGNLDGNNCSWPASEEYLTRFEYFRSVLNGNRELCGWWVKSDVAPSTLTTAQVQAIAKDASLMAKWVLDPSVAPYPVLKPQGKYPSIVNPDPERRIDPATKQWVNRSSDTENLTAKAVPDTEGQTLGTISVTINAGDHHAGSGSTSEARTLTVTAMDFDNLDYCFGKIQLPYYNEVFGNPDATEWKDKYGGNYTDYAVTGWKVTAVSDDGRERNSFVANWESGYNFADRQCTEKDIYGKSNRVFAQGGYYYVPDGVTSITIEAYWGKAKYLYSADRRYDIITNQQFQPAGQHPDKFPASTGQAVYTGIYNVLKAYLDGGDNTVFGKTVYDNAVVLVGNYQIQNGTAENFAVRSGDNRAPFTMMSADLDFDNEPDYCLVLQAGSGATRYTINPVRFDFVSVVDMGVAMRQDGSSNVLGVGICLTKGHFEVTETALMYFNQLEYDEYNYQGSKTAAPFILNGGHVDEMCSSVANTTCDRTQYFILGGHLWMKAFTPGTHVTQKNKTRHCAVSVLGGDIEGLYLSGKFNADASVYVDNPHCYIGGGKFDFVAGASVEQINGNVTWQIDHAVIGEFYGGGINADKPVTGSIGVTISRSQVGKYCGGPQFGDMVSGKTVTTQATGCTFEEYYGGGNGGTSYAQKATGDNNGTTQWSSDAAWGMNGYTPGAYIDESKGYYAKYEWQIINLPSGTAASDTRRYYLYGAQFATTDTGPVENVMDHCTFEGNFYGAGNLGGVNGNVTSTLTDCEVRGSAFGAGYSASVPTFELLTKQGYSLPSHNYTTGVIDHGDVGEKAIYKWTNETSLGGQTLSTSHPMVTVGGVNYMFTEVSLENLGAVSGKCTLTIDGGTKVAGSVYGGGNESAVNNETTPADASTEVTIKGNTTVEHDVFGGGNKGSVSGSTTVNIQE